MLKSRGTCCKLIHCGWLATVLLTAACPQSEQPNGHTARQGLSIGDQAQSAAAESLFTGTDYESHPPQALDINRDGTRLFIKHFAPGGNPTEIYTHELTAAGMGEQVSLMQSGETFRAFVRAHPTDLECLAIGNEQLPDSPVIDTVWRCGPTGRARLRYSNAPDLPGQLPPDARYGLSPFYSWDGDSVIVPLHAGGLCVMPRTGRGRFIAYPELPAEPSGQAFGALPSDDGGQLIYVSRWYKGADADRGFVQSSWCHVYVLNIDTGEWSPPVSLESEQTPWIIYEVAGDDPLSVPWLVRGGRPPDRTRAENNWMPRLARVDPTTGVVELLAFHGRPYWPVALEPHGKYVVYADQQRQAITRLDPLAAALDFDPRFYHEELQLFVSEGDDPAYVWHGGLLARVAFSEHESFAKE